MKTCMFPGQGSQTVGMGAELFDAFTDWVARADEILGYSIRELCLEDPRKELDNTRFTQPALYVVNALSYAKRERDGGEAPDYLVGHSLGEFNALLAAGCYSFDTGLRIVQRRGELMSRISGGAMAAVINATPEEIETALREGELANVSLANFNTPSQIVISGLKDEIDAAQALLQKGRVLFFPLKTSGAFHTRFMAEAQAEFRTFLGGFELAAPRIPVVANLTARPYEADAVIDTIAGQMASPVRWSDTIQYLHALGDEATPMDFEEVGNGDVLTRLLRGNRGPVVRAEPAAPVASVAPMAREATPVADDASSQDKVTAWNRTNAIGTPVRSVHVDDILRTRSEAVILFGHRAAVYVEGYEGYFDLDEVAVA